MFHAWILSFLLLSGAKAFMLHNTQTSQCLEESATAGQVLLKNCDLDSESQQWVWIARGMLMSVASSRCLSALQGEPVQTRSCWEAGADVKGLTWDCDRGRLISRNASMLLAVDGRRPVLSHVSKLSKWWSLDEGDVCQEKLRSRRASSDPQEFEAVEDQTPKMTEEQRKYMLWYYRTEDSTMWTFVLLGLAFVCLLIGFLLLGMGAMANKNRKKIAKYKAAAAAAQKGEELEVISTLRDEPSPSQQRSMQSDKPALSNGDASELKAGDIVVTWRDGNTSCLYPDPPAEEENQEEEEEEEVQEEEVQEVVSAAGLEVDSIVKSPSELV